MTLILSGTDGLSDIDGSAATPAIRGTDANTGIFFGADTVGISTGGTSALSIDASQVVTLTNALPVASGGTGVTTSTGTGAVVLGTSPSISGAVLSSMASSVITSGTAVASTSGTSIDFTGIPSWVKRITVMFQGVSTTGASKTIIQLGDSGGVETSGYLGSSTFADGSGTAENFSSGFIFSMRTGGTAAIRHGVIVLSLVDSSTNAWAEMGNIGSSDTAAVTVSAGSKALSATLDRVRITTVSGTDTFDAGSINILFE